MFHFIQNMAFLNLRRRRGQGLTIEYAVLFFIVIAAITTMSVYAKRAVQSRVRGARNYMVKQVEVAYQNLHPSANFRFEYEPYYVKTQIDKDEYTATYENQRPWTNHEGKFETGMSSTISSRTSSNVSPAANAD